MNIETNKFEKLIAAKGFYSKLQAEDRQGNFHTNLVRPDGSLVPKVWPIFTIDELVVIKNYTFKVVYIGESNILLESVKPEDITFKGE